MLAGAPISYLWASYLAAQHCASRLEELGIKFDSKEEFKAVFVRFKALADKKREIFDEDLQALVSEVQMGTEADALTLVDLEVLSNLDSRPRQKLLSPIRVKSTVPKPRAMVLSMRSLMRLKSWLAATPICSFTRSMRLPRGLIPRVV